MYKTRTYAFDFDGVIAKYDGQFKGHDYAEEPIEEVIKTIRVLKERGNKIIIYSTRGNNFLKEYCNKYDIPVDYFNENPNIEGENKGKPIATVYIDDRGLRYIGQSSEKLIKELEDFKPYRQI